MTVLGIVQSVCGEIGLRQPNSLVGTSDLQVVQLRSLLNREGTELAARSSSGWQALIREATFTTLNQEDQGAIDDIIGAANAYRHILNETMWNRTKRIPLFGPRNPRIWQGFKALTFAGPYGEYRIRGGHLLIMPIPAADEVYYFEYASKNWLTSSDGSMQRSAIVADDDMPLLDDEILKAGLTWRWKRAKELDYSEEFNMYEARVIDALSRDGTKPRMNLGDSGLSDSRVPIAIPRLIGS